MTQENTLARHTILHELGRGTIGAVYAAKDRATGAVVALKRLDPAHASLADGFVKHARSAAQLKHRNIVQVHDAGKAAGTAYVTMEMLEGESLRKLLDKGPLPVARAIRIARDVAAGLAHAHLQGVMHGGIKPSNVIVTRSGAAKITDFGTGQPGNTPEQLRNDPVDHRSDIFMLGVLFYEMLAHRPPFGGSPSQTIETLRPPGDFNPNVPRALDAIVLRMLAAQPADRFPGMPVVVNELQRVEEALGLHAAVAPDQPVSPAKDRHPRANESGAGAQPSVAPAHAGAQRRDPELHDTDFGGIRPGASDDEPVLDRNRIAADPDEFDYRRAMMHRESRREQQRPSASKAAMFAALFLVPAALAGAGYVYYLSEGAPSVTEVARRAAAMAETPREPVAAFGKWEATPPWARNVEPPRAEPKQEPPKQEAAPKQEEAPRHEVAKQEPPAVNTPRPVAPPPVAKKIEEPAPLPVVAEPVAEAKEPAGTGLTVPPSMAEAPGKRETAPEPPQAAAPPPPAPAQEQPAAAKVPGQRPARMAHLILTVSPGGDVYINGQRQGTTPEITTFDLEPGMHHIEVRNGSRKPYVTYMTVEPGDVRRIRHDFDAKPSRPPVGIDRPSR